MPPSGRFTNLYFASVDPQQNLYTQDRKLKTKKAEAALCLGLILASSHSFPPLSQNTERKDSHHTTQIYAYFHFKRRFTAIFFFSAVKAEHSTDPLCSGFPECFTEIC